MKQAIAYLRVPLKNKSITSLLKHKRLFVEKEATKRDLQLEKIFTDEGKSAKKLFLVGLLYSNSLNIVGTKQNTIQALIVYRLDRLSRQTADHLAIRKKLADLNITLYSATEPTGDSPTEKLVRNNPSWICSVG